MGDDAAQRIIDDFVAAMLKGKRLPVLRSDGVESTSLVQMDKDVTCLTITVGSRRETILLETVGQITMGEEVPEGYPALWVDELCVTLALEDTGEAVAFRFEDMEDRDTFALCTGMFVDQRRQAMEGGEGEEEWYEEDEAYEEGHAEDAEEYCDEEEAPEAQEPAAPRVEAPSTAKAGGALATPPPPKPTSLPAGPTGALPWVSPGGKAPPSATAAAPGALPAPLGAVPACAAHTFRHADFWKPTWCADCKTLLTGWSKQGETCTACRTVLCHKCAAKSSRCPAADAQAAPQRRAVAPSAAVPPPPPPQRPGRALGAEAGPQCLLLGGGEGGSARNGFTDSVDSARSGLSAFRSGYSGELTDGQRVIKSFVQRMVRGRTLRMLSKTGGSVQCLVHLDRELKHIYIQRAGMRDAKKRSISLRSVQDICIGRDLDEEVELPLDDLSVTLLLDEGAAIAFRLEDEEDRDVFAKCVRMFVRGVKKEAARQARHR